MINSSLKKLEVHRKEILDATASSILAEDAMYPFDMMIWAASKRSLCLIESFTHLIETKNFMVAASLVRMHLDSLLRLYAATLVDGLHEFSNKVLAGERISNIKDRDGKRLTDAYLVKKFTTHEPWVESVYKNTCGYIHLSEKHMINCFSIPNDEGTSQVVIGSEDAFIPDEARIEAIEAMIAISKNIIGLIDHWSITKKTVAEAK